MFSISSGKGFYMEFANGYGISVQFGAGNYCAHKERFDWGSSDYAATQIKLGKEGCNDAEIAIISPDGDMNGKSLGIFEGDDVEGWCTPERVLEVMNLIAKKQVREMT